MINSTTVLSLTDWARVLLTLGGSGSPPDDYMVSGVAVYLMWSAFNATPMGDSGSQPGQGYGDVAANYIWDNATPTGDPGSPPVQGGGYGALDAASNAIWGSLINGNTIPLNLSDPGFTTGAEEGVPVVDNLSPTPPTTWTSNGITNTTYPDGTVTVEYPDGSSSVTDPTTHVTVTTTAGGIIITDDPANGSRTVANADGSGWTVVENTNDGTKTYDHSDGTHYTQDANGVKTGFENNADGSKTVYPGDGTSHVEPAPGSQPATPQAQNQPTAPQPPDRPPPPDPPMDGGAVQSVSAYEKVAVRMLTFPDGSTTSHYVDDPNGKVVVTSPGGPTITTTNDGSTRVNPDGSIETVNYNDNTKTVTQPNGTTTTYPGDGGKPTVTGGTPPPPPAGGSEPPPPPESETVTGKVATDTAKSAVGELLGRKVGPGPGKVLETYGTLSNIKGLGDNMNEALRIVRVEQGRIHDNIEAVGGRWANGPAYRAGSLTQQSIHNSVAPMMETIQNVLGSQ